MSASQLAASSSQNVHGGGAGTGPGPRSARDYGHSCREPGSSDRLVYSVAEAARLLDISRAFAYELVARGELPVIRPGRRRLVPKVALMALVGPLSDALPE